MRVAIHHEGKEGFVRYNKQNKELMVTHPNEAVRNTVRHYLTTERGFTTDIGGSNDPSTGNRMIVYKTPNDNPDDLAQAMSEMHSNTGVHVNWGHEDNDLSSLQSAGTEPDKPILKSLDDDETFDIIN